MRAIRLVKAGDVGAARGLLQAQAEALVAAGCRQVVLACTEVPVALTGRVGALRPMLLDATKALARACVAAAIEPARRAA
jgi:aspartate racemase